MAGASSRAPADALPAEVDVLVVGAGPTGSNVARLLAARGHRVLMVEEHPTVGLPVQCAGLVAPRLFEHTPFPIGDLWQNDLHGAKVYAPDGTAVVFETEKVQAQAMDRARFDQRMAQAAVAAGVELRTGTKAVAAQRDGEGIAVLLRSARPAAAVSVRAAAAQAAAGGITVLEAPGAAVGNTAAGDPATGGITGNTAAVTAPADTAAVTAPADAAAGNATRTETADSATPGNPAAGSAAADATVRCRLLIGADGIRGSVARWFGFPAVQEHVSAYEVELSGCHLPDGPRIIPMFAGRAQAPGFFSWIIPVGGDRTRSGLAVAPGMNEAAAKAYYERMFEDPASATYLRGSDEVYRIIGGIPLGLRDRLVDDGVALVGDAAGMAKPTSGGGIYMGLVAGEHLAEVADAALRRGDVSRGALRPYERRVRRSIGRELRKGRLLRAVYKRFSDEDLNRLARLCNRPRVRRAIERHGDIDYPSRLVLPLLRAEPRFAALFVRVMLRRRS